MLSIEVALWWNRTTDLLFTRQTQYHYAKKAYSLGGELNSHVTITINRTKLLQS